MQIDRANTSLPRIREPPAGLSINDWFVFSSMFYDFISSLHALLALFMADCVNFIISQYFW